MISTTITVNGKEHHLVVFQPSGGGSYHVLIDDYYCGEIVKYKDGWTPLIKTPLLYSDDIGAVLDMIEGE